MSIRLAASGIDLDPVEADSSSPCCLGAGGSHYVESATIRESSDVPGEQNTLYLTVATSFSLGIGTILTVTGLTGTQTSTSPAVVISNDKSLTASWSQEGSLIFSVSSNLYDCYQCETNPPTLCSTRRKVSISFQLQNPLSQQQFAQISESSQVFAQPAAPGDVNLVTVTMRANKPLQACETALYKPDPASQATWITDARSLSV